MDRKHATATKRKDSVLQLGDEIFFNKVISRNSSVGNCSSRLFYYRSAEGVPFQWEMQPGTPKDPPKREVLPPLSPPPAVLSLGLPKPCLHDTDEPKLVSTKLRLKFWKHIKKIGGSKNTHQGFKRNTNNNKMVNANSKFESFYFCSSDGECMGSPPRNSNFSSSSSSSSSLSSSSVLSFSDGHSRNSSGLRGPARDSIHGIYGCSPWKFNSILVRVARPSGY